MAPASPSQSMAQAGQAGWAFRRAAWAFGNAAPGARLAGSPGGPPGPSGTPPRVPGRLGLPAGRPGFWPAAAPGPPGRGRGRLRCAHVCCHRRAHRRRRPAGRPGARRARRARPAGRVDHGHGQGRRRSTITTCGRCAAWASRADRLPIVLGCDAAGLDADGNEVVVHAVISDPAARGGDETMDPAAVAAVRALRRDVRRAGRRAPAQPGAQARRAVLRRGRLPADGVPDRLPDAVHPGRDEPGATVLVQGAGGGVATALILLGRAAGLPGLGDQPQRGQAGPRPALGADQASRPGPAAGAGGRGDGDGRRGHLGALAARAQARRADRDLRRDQRLDAAAPT